MLLCGGGRGRHNDIYKGPPARMPSLRTTDFLGIGFTQANYVAIAAELDRMSLAQGLSLVVTPNVDHVVMLRDATSFDETTELFARAYDAATLRLCDSRVLQALAWTKGIGLEVVTGSDLTALLFEQGWLDNRKVALIGGDEKMSAELNAKFPAVNVSQHIPPMGALKNERAILAVEEFLAGEQWHYILFALGAPTSEIIAHRIMRIDGMKGVAICIGASIEFMLGRKVRAPKWLRAARLEWAFRLATEPRRLWRRYLVKGPRILSIARKWHPD